MARRQQISGWTTYRDATGVIHYAYQPVDPSIATQSENGSQNFAITPNQTTRPAPPVTIGGFGAQRGIVIPTPDYVPTRIRSVGAYQSGDVNTLYREGAWVNYTEDAWTIIVPGPGNYEIVTFPTEDYKYAHNFPLGAGDLTAEFGTVLGALTSNGIDIIFTGNADTAVKSGNYNVFTKDDLQLQVYEPAGGDKSWMIFYDANTNMTYFKISQVICSCISNTNSWILGGTKIFVYEPNLDVTYKYITTTNREIEIRLIAQPENLTSTTPVLSRDDSYWWSMPPPSDFATEYNADWDVDVFAQVDSNGTKYWPLSKMTVAYGNASRIVWSQLKTMAHGDTHTMLVTVERYSADDYPPDPAFFEMKHEVWGKSTSSSDFDVLLYTKSYSYTWPAGGD